MQLGGGIRDRATIEAGSAKGVRAGDPRHRGAARPGAGARGGARRIRAGSRSASTPATGGSRSRAGPRPATTAASTSPGASRTPGVAAIVYTDIDRDGALQGPNVAATAALARAVAVPVIASGGIASMDDLRALKASGAPLDGAISGRALYEGRIDLGEARAAAGGLMLKVRVIPCLDVKDGRVVKGVNFVDLRDAGDPVEAARAYDAAGADELCFLDIAASQENRGTLLDLASPHRRAVLHAADRRRRGADARGCAGAAAGRGRQGELQHRRRRDPEVISASAEKFGSQCITVAIDARTVAPGRWEIFTHGGTRATGIDAVGFAREMERRGAGEILLTSMDRDGTRAGYNLPLTRAVADAVGMPVIASGGVGTLEHLVEGVTEGHASAVLAASIFHFGQHSIAEAKAAMAAAGMPVRPT